MKGARLHLRQTSSPDVPLCPEEAARDAMDDMEWEAHIGASLSGVGVGEPGGPGWDWDDDQPDDGLLASATACPECGELRACGWDSEGRPLIHAIRAGSEADR